MNNSHAIKTASRDHAITRTTTGSQTSDNFNCLRSLSLPTPTNIIGTECIWAARYLIIRNERDLNKRQFNGKKTLKERKLTRKRSITFQNEGN